MTLPLPTPGVTPDGEWAGMLNAAIAAKMDPPDFAQYPGSLLGVPSTLSSGSVPSVDRDGMFLQYMLLWRPVVVDRVTMHVENTADPANQLRLSLYKQTGLTRFEKQFAFGDVAATPFSASIDGLWTLPAGLSMLGISCVPGIGSGSVGVMSARDFPYPSEIVNHPEGNTNSFRLDADKSHPPVLDFGEGIYSVYGGANFWWRFRRAASFDDI